MNLIQLPWDSSFFGFRIAKVEVFGQDDIQSLLAREDSLKKQYDLVYIFAEPGLVWPVGKMLLVDKKAVFTMDAISQSDKSGNVRRWPLLYTTDELIQLAMTSGKYSRFKLDGHFAQGSFERLYTHWIEQSVNHTIATDVFSYFEEDLPIGLVTLNFDKENSQIGLVAVNEKYQQKGIGLSMMRFVIDYSYQKQGNHLSVVTQLDNVAACRLYQKCGFSLISVTEVRHWWL